MVWRIRDHCDAGMDVFGDTAIALENAGAEIIGAWAAYKHPARPGPWERTRVFESSFESRRRPPQGCTSSLPTRGSSAVPTAPFLSAPRSLPPESRRNDLRPF